MDLTRIEAQSLQAQPYQWAFVNGLFAPGEAAALAASFPRDHFKTVHGYDGEKGYAYEARALIHMGAGDVSHAEGLSAAWRQLAADLHSPAYRRALSGLTGRDLTAALVEVNAFHYPPRAWLGPHLDLNDKIVTHVLYFNETWRTDDGGCLNILKSSDMADVFAETAPVIGNSAVLVRSQSSWHAVSRVAEACRRSRRSVTVTFYHPGSVSTLWPPGETPRLHRFDEADEARPMREGGGVLAALRHTLSSWTRS